MATRTTAAPERPRPPSAVPRTIYALPGSAREGIVASLVAVGAGLVVAMWWQDTPASSLKAPGEVLTSVGRVTGLVGTYLVLVEVLLMGRVPWLDRLIGMDRLSVWHRRVGEYVVWLLVGHTLFTIWGYGVADQVNVASETRTMVLTYPDMLMATVGLGLLVAIGVTSARFARRRLSYETWYFIHLYSYLAIALSFAHQLATGNDFATERFNRYVWVAMYVGVGALLAWHRIGVLVRDALRHRLRIAAVVPETPGVVSVYVDGRRLDELRVDAGQFVRWRFLTRHGWWQAHPFSLSAAPNGQWLRLTVKALGDHTESLAELHPGIAVIAEGPYGAFTRHRRTRRRVLLVAGGIGIAPIRALFEGLPARPGELTLLYRVSSPEQVVFRDEIDAIAEARGATVHYLVGPRSIRPDPLRYPHLGALVPDLAHHDVYVCGPPGLTSELIKSLRDYGVKRRHIHTEGFEY